MAAQYRFLVAFDTDRIKEYVFATDKLREVRGASRLLTILNEGAPDAKAEQSLTEKEIQQVSPDYQRVFFGGGSGAVLVPSQDEALKVVQAVESLYQRKTFNGSITGVCLPLARAPETEGFGASMALARLKLREKKDENAHRLLPGIRPYTQPCAACERHPAVTVSPIDQAPLCQSCTAKREAFKEYRDKSAQDAPDDLEALGEVARPPGYIGFIYADGNSTGEWTERLSSVKQYKDFAEGLNALVQSAVRDALEKYPHRRQKDQEVRPYETLLVGGDDLMLVTAGDVAFSVALEIANTYEAGSVKVLQSAGLPSERPLTLATGLVLAHASFPMAAFNRLARQLCRRAKQRCAEVDYREGALDFMVVTAAGSSDLKIARDDVLTQHSFAFSHGPREVRLTQRPYTLTEARKLLEHTQTFKGANFPRSQLQLLYEGLFHSQIEAVYRWGKVAGRVDEKKHYPVMKKFYESFGDRSGGFPPWRQGDNPRGVDFTSALGDLVEIYPFVPSAGKGGHDATDDS